MAAKHSRHVTLTEPLAQFVDDLVREGRYASASEVVRAGLMLLKRDEADVHAEHMNPHFHGERDAR